MPPQTTTTATYDGVTFSESDVLNLDDWIPIGESNPHHVRPFLLHDHGFPLCVVFAACLQDALDEAADGGKLDRYQVTEADLVEDYDADENGITRLGNAGEPFDVESLGVIELPNPPRSFVAQFRDAFSSNSAGQGAPMHATR